MFATVQDLTGEREGREKFFDDSRFSRDSCLYLNWQQTSSSVLLAELVKIRASQINGCAYCIDMHTKDARLAGETEQRIYALNAWRETPFFTDRERAALEWTEAVTRIADTHAADDIYDRVAQHFDEAELVALTMAVVVINAWNRISISFRPPVGSYQPKAVAVG
jgi:AhpD family alkylhydroperoxidase